MQLIKNATNTKFIAFSILAILFVYACIILFFSSSTYDTGDGVAHYLISRYSWHHHRLFVDDWGKPFFTMLSSPFAQFGLKGITLYNILCGLGASYFAYRIAEKLAIPFPYLAIIFTFSAPIYFSVVNSGLTEPMFSMMLIGCIWLIMNERYYLSAILFSFLPFVRAEFIFVLPLFIFYYILKRKYLANFLLPVGTIIITLIGAIYYKNLHWLLDQNPYSESNSHAYGNVKGSLISYIAPAHDIVGLGLLILIIAGVLWFIGGEYLNRRVATGTENAYRTEEVLLVYGCVFNIFVGHTIIWATGFFPTLGLLRYMAPLIPLASIIALRGLQFINLIPDVFKFTKVKTWIATVFVIAVLYAPYDLWYKIPFKLGAEEVVIKDATDWLKQTPDANKKIFYLAPYITPSLNIDPYDTAKRGELWGMNSQRPDLNMPQGSIMIWDSHYGPNEGKIKLDTLLKNPNLTLLRRFDPKEKFTVLGGMDYGVWIFKKK